MKIHKIEEALGKAIRDVQIELSAMSEGDRNQYNETKASLTEELAFLQAIAKQIEEWNLERSRRAIERMSKIYL
jgi:hypothetical protein